MNGGLPCRNLLLLYGSESGCAQDVAECVWREARRRRFSCRLLEMDQFEFDALPQQQLVVFVCATAGQGEETSNMRAFWRRLRKRSLAADWLKSTMVAVLGLGDSGYQKFNFAAKKLYRRLVQLGADMLMELGLADDQHELGSDAVVEPWCNNLWITLDQQYPLPKGVHPIAPEEFLPPKYVLKWLDDPAMGVLDGTNSSYDNDSDREKPFVAKLASNDRVTADDHWQDTRLIRLDFSETELRYEPGDVAMLHPCNLSETVSIAVEALGIAEMLDRPFALCLSAENIQLPPEYLLSRNGTTPRDCLTNFWDLQGVPKRSFFQLLAQFATDEMERERLLEFCQPENQEDLYDYCNRQRRSVAEVLRDFHDTSQRVPFEYLFDLLPTIRSRAVSIASCQQVHGVHLELLVAVVQYRTRMSTPRLGLCSNWLARLESGATVPLWIRKGTFRFPSLPVPSILIGPGTGVAPFRSYAHWRHFENAALEIAEESPSLLLFFGCRKRKADFYFENEWPRLGLKLQCAFSQDQPSKIYVQHKIEEQAELVWKFLSATADASTVGCVFIAGNAKEMPKAVVDALKWVISSQTELSVAETENFIEKMERNGRLQMETWS